MFQEIECWKILDLDQIQKDIHLRKRKPEIEDQAGNRRGQERKKGTGL